VKRGKSPRARTGLVLLVERRSGFGSKCSAQGWGLDSISESWVFRKNSNTYLNRVAVKMSVIVHAVTHS
jgi:hypothetical protein